MKDRECLLGEICGGKIELSRVGEIVKGCWEEIPNHFSNATIDEYMIMPDHLHGILFLKEQDSLPVGVEYIQPQRGKSRDASVRVQ